MAGAFETVGNDIKNLISTYATDVSSLLITNLSPIIIVGVTIYLMVKGYLYMTGRAEGALGELIINWVKISMLAYVALNSGNFIYHVIGGINGAESFLMRAVAPNAASTSVYATIDDLWVSICDSVASFFTIVKNIKFGLTNIGSALFIAFMLVLVLFIYLIVIAYLTFAALGITILTEMSLVIVLGFGPLFICLLMFPLTKSWFDGWLKAAMTYVFTLVIMAAVIGLVVTIFRNQMNSFNQVFVEAESLNPATMGIFLLKFFTFIIVVVAMSSLVKAVPTIASGIVGGVAMQATGLGKMLSGIGQGAASMGPKALTAAALMSKNPLTAIRAGNAAKLLGGNSISRSYNRVKNSTSSASR